MTPSEMMLLPRDTELVELCTRRSFMADELTDELVAIIDSDLLNGTKESVDFAARFGLRCGFCGGSGEVDSGGQNPWGGFISLHCPECGGDGIMAEQSPEDTASGESLGFADPCKVGQLVRFYGFKVTFAIQKVYWAREHKCVWVFMVTARHPGMGGSALTVTRPFRDVAWYGDAPAPAPVPVPS